MKHLLVTTIFFILLLSGCAGSAQTIAPTAEPTLSPSQPTSETPSEGSAGRGAALINEGQGGLPACSTCHTLDDTRLVGPGLKDIDTRAGQQVSGETAEVYIYNSITSPGSYLVEGYQDIMPPNYADILSDEQIQDLIVYLLTPTG